MRLIKQENKLGCGVACVASILNLSYRNALKLFPKNRAEKHGFICKEIVQALGRGGLRYEYKYIKPRFENKIYGEDTVVFIQRSRKYPEGHYLVRKDRKWIDSWINFPNKKRRAGFRKKLPGRPIYAILNTVLLNRKSQQPVSSNNQPQH